MLFVNIVMFLFNLFAFLGTILVVAILVLYFISMFRELNPNNIIVKLLKRKFDIVSDILLIFIACFFLKAMPVGFKLEDERIRIFLSLF
jgi:hypothetical protein